VTCRWQTKVKAETRLDESQANVALTADWLLVQADRRCCTGARGRARIVAMTAAQPLRVVSHNERQHQSQNSSERYPTRK
jgi:hypothetical protein